MNNTEQRLEQLKKQLITKYSLAEEIWLSVSLLVQKAHQNQFRNNQRSYLDHVLNVAEILLSWNVDVMTIMAGLLHNAVYDGHIESLKEINHPLNRNVLSQILDLIASLDVGNRRISPIRNDHHLSEFFLLIKRPFGLQAVLVCCANRLANLRDLRAFKGKPREHLLSNTELVYLPLLDHLGIWKVRIEIETLLLQARTPERYRLLTQWQRKQRKKRQDDIERWRIELKNALSQRGLEQVAVKIIYRSPASTWRRHLVDFPRSHADTLSQLDGRHLFTTVVLVSQVNEAYLALAGIHQSGIPSTATFRDYLAQPKANGYSALNTTIVVNSEPHRLRIQTHTLYSIAQNGILFPMAYQAWLEGGPLPDSCQGVERQALSTLMNTLRQRKTDWIASLTPKGEVIHLRRGATVLDFAYAIHTEIGRQTRAAWVNKVQVPLNTELHSGDMVEIRKDPDRQWPNPQWIDWVRTNKARNAIQLQLRQRPAIKGYNLLDKALRQQQQKLEDYTSQLSTLATEMGRTREEIFIAIAEGTLNAEDVAKCLLTVKSQQRTTFYHVRLTPESIARFPLWHDDMLVRVDCCNPPPGTQVMGYHNQQSVELHRADCASLIDPTRKVRLYWQAERVKVQLIKFTLRAVNRKGLIYDLTYILKQAHVDIVYLEGKQLGEMDEINLTVEVTNKLELGYLLSTIRGLPGVNRVLVNGEEADSASASLQAYLAPPEPIISPFSPGRPVTGKGAFWGRGSEVTQIETQLQAKNPTSLLIQGPRRIGKTSLLKHLNDSRVIRNKYRYVYVDLQSVAYSDIASVLRLIARHLARTSRRVQTSSKWTYSVEIPTMAELTATPQDTFLSYLADLTDSNRYTQKRILLALDEFGTLVESIRANVLDTRIFHLLRSVIQHNPLVTILLCTSDNLANLLAEEGVLELLNVTNTVRLSYLSNQAAQQLIQEPLRGQVYFEPKAIETLLHVTGKHPYYLQIIGSNLITRLNYDERRQVYESDIQRLARHQTNLNGSEFMHLWQTEDVLQHHVLQALCMPPATSAVSPFGAELLQHRLQQANRPFTLESIAQTLEQLTYMDTLTRVPGSDGANRYYVRVELFRDWFAAHHPLIVKN